MATIALDRVVKRYRDGFAAVNDVSLEIADGELMILVGPSGCGKSTLLRMIAGLEEVTSGEVRIAGERVNERPPRERDLAMVFQSYALYPHLTVFENIAFPLRLRRLAEDEIRKRVEDAADLLDLREHLARKPAQLSGGQRQRVAMGRAIVREARAFLFDEPLSNLDASLRGQMRTEIARLQRRLRTTTVYVTHDQTEAMTLGDRVAVLRKGVLEQVGTPRELYERPANLFVGGFIGSPPMNLVPAVIEGRSVRLPFVTIELPQEIARHLAGERFVIVGVRPEHMADAALVKEDERARGVEFEATIDVIEWLGAQQLAYVPFEAEREAADRFANLARELDVDTLRPQLVASIDPASRLREREPTKIWLDTNAIHWFDASSGSSIRRSE